MAANSSVNAKTQTATRELLAQLTGNQRLVKLLENLSSDVSVAIPGALDQLQEASEGTRAMAILINAIAAQALDIAQEANERPVLPLSNNAEPLPLGGVVIPNFTMLPVTAGGPVSRRWEHADTNAGIWNTGPGRMTFRGKFTSTGYFAANPNAHFIVGLRVDTSVVALQPRFHGVSCGNLIGAADGCPWAPMMQIESRATGLDPGGALRFLIPNAWTPSGKLVQDGIEYDLLVDSVLADSGRRTIRFCLSVENAAVSGVGDTVYDLIVDTGGCLDPNTFLDMTQQGLVFASVFEDNLAPWSIDWHGMTATWSAAPGVATDATERISRYGDTMENDLVFGAGAGISMPAVTVGSGIPAVSENIGLSTARLYGLNSYGDAAALALTQAAQNMATYCAPGNIAAAIGAAPANVGTAVESALRPAYGMISNIYADLKARGIL